MRSKKAILWPVIISIIGHAALISASGIIDLRENVKALEIFTVNIKEQPQPTPKEEEEEEEKALAQPPLQPTKLIRKHESWREDTVNLGTSDSKYSYYLNMIRNRILQIWRYPQKAYDKNEEGVVVIKMSIDANGILAGTSLMSSSGSILLDDDALGVVKAAGPFEPLPANYNLSRLHIVASFNYSLAN